MSKWQGVRASQGRPDRPPLPAHPQGGEGGSNIIDEQQGDSMARIIVTTDPITNQDADPTTNQDAPVLLEESVYAIHLDNDHSAAQLIERLGWAIADAEQAEQAP